MLNYPHYTSTYNNAMADLAAQDYSFAAKAVQLLAAHNNQLPEENLCSGVDLQLANNAIAAG